MNLNTYQRACLAFFALLVACWIALYASGSLEGFWNNLYVFAYGLIPLVGGLLAMRGFRTWGGLSTILGRAIFFLGTGLFLWGVGETVWSYYNFFLDVEIPYPSAADYFFAPSVFFYTLGTIFLSMTTGARLALKNWVGKLFAVLAPIVIFALTYYVLIVIGQGGEFIPDESSALKATLDIAYPLGDAVSLAVAVVVAGLSFRYMGGRYKYDILSVLAGLAAMFVADSILAYTSTIGTAYSGDWGDLAFTVGVFFLTFGLLGFNKLKNGEAPAVTV